LIDAAALSKKAELISAGRLYVDPAIRLPFPTGRSTAGPGAGGRSIALAFFGTRVKLGISRKRPDGDGDRPQNFELVFLPDPAAAATKSCGLACGCGRYAILKDGMPFIDEVKIISDAYHAPEQCFLNLRNRCVFDCAFCNSPALESDFLESYSPSDFAAIVDKAIKEGGAKSVAFTSSVPSSVDEQVGLMAECVRLVRQKHPDIEIGVEPLCLDLTQVQKLKDAGADELKLNLQSYDESVFSRVCPNIDRKRLLATVEGASAIFGRGKVTSNIIYGLGESDECVLEGVKWLAERGVVANLRALRVNDGNRERLTGALSFTPEKPSPERMEGLAETHAKILADYGLSTSTFKTMCFPCKCCDLEVIL